MSIGGSSGNTDSNGTTSGTTANQALSYLSGASSSQANNAQQLQGALDTAGTIYGQGGYNGGSQTVNRGVGSVEQGAGQAQGIDAAGNNEVTGTLNGNYLSAGNPYFQQMVTQAGQAIKPTVDSTFEANGRYGSGAHAAALDSALANESGQLAYGNYANERGIQQATAASLPSYTAGLTQPGQAQITAGQSKLASDYTPLNQYLSALSTISPGSSTTNASTTAIDQSGKTSGVSNGTGSSDNSHAATK